MERKGIAYTAEQIDALLRRGELERLGMGSRRACYRLPGTDLCVKCYRSDEEIEEGKYPGSQPITPLSSTVLREIHRCRFDEQRNTCCQEHEYWNSLKEHLPKDLMSVFPSSMEKKRLPSRGWCVVEELVMNADGSPVVKFHEALRGADRVLCANLLDKFGRLETELARFAVRMYDPQNVLVQRCLDGSFRMRIADFEPVSRTLISLDRAPFIVRMKIRRRFARYRRVFGIHGV